MAERRIAGLTVRIDESLCVGFGDCVQEAEELFALDGDGVVEFRDEAGTADAARVLDACRACPVDALTVLDASGRQMVP